MRSRLRSSSRSSSRSRLVVAVVGALTVQACGSLQSGRPSSPPPATAPAPAGNTPTTTAPPRATPAAPGGAAVSTPPSAATPAGAPAAAPATAPVAVARPAELASAIAARRTALLADGATLGADEVGYYMDVQEARLRQLAPSGFEVARRDSGLVVTIPGRQTFDVGSARLLPSGLPALSELAKVLVEYRLTIVALNGYTDSSGDAASNVALSQARAIAVSRHLLGEGVAAKRMVALGFGDADPVADNATAEGRERNRRVEVRILPLRP